MLVKEVKSIAVKKGVKPGKMKKAELIKAIQIAEGNDSCFKGIISKNCKETGCLWYGDCVTKSK